MGLIVAGIAAIIRAGVGLRLLIGDSYFSDPWLRTEGDHLVIAGGVPPMLKT